jgi:hypothetical protein
MRCVEPDFQSDPRLDKQSTQRRLEGATPFDAVTCGGYLAM